MAESHQDKVVRLLEGLNRNMENLNARTLASQGSQEGESHHSMEDIDNCPTCRGRYKTDEFKTKTIKKAWEERKNLHAECSTCGFPLKLHDHDGYNEETEDKNCPLCGSTKARNRYVDEE